MTEYCPFQSCDEVKLVGEEGKKVCPRCLAYQVDTSDPKDYGRSLKDKEKRERLE